MKPTPRHNRATMPLLRAVESGRQRREFPSNKRFPLYRGALRSIRIPVAVLKKPCSSGVFRSVPYIAPYTGSRPNSAQRSSSPRRSTTWRSPAQDQDQAPRPLEVAADARLPRAASRRFSAEARRRAASPRGRGAGARRVRASALLGGRRGAGAPRPAGRTRVYALEPAT